MSDAADGTKPVYKTTEHRYQVDRDLNSNKRRMLNKIDAGELDAGWSCQMRAILPGDFHFVLNAWMQSFRVAARGVNNEDFYKGQQNLIAEIAKRRTLIVACDAKLPDYIYGFIAGALFKDGRVLIDYVYVKKMYRGRGVAQGLLAALGYKMEIGAIVTHVTPCVRDIVLAHKLAYNPYYNMLGYSDV